MRHSLRGWLGLLLLSCLPASAKPGHDRAPGSAPVDQRDWKQYPAIVELPATDLLYALGDVHGDCDRMLELLAAGRLIGGVPATPDAVVWTGGKATLVLTGDMIDKYDHSIEVITALRALGPQAQKAGGRVIVCLGNHEAEFLASGGEGKKGADFEKELKAAKIAPEDVAAGRDSAGIGAWMRTLPAGAKVGGWFFCHAGNTHEKSVAALASELEKDLATQGYTTPLLIDPNSMLEARMHPRPWWEGDGDPSLHDAKTQKTPGGADEPTHRHMQGTPLRLSDSVHALGAEHLVIGHQPGMAKFADGAIREEGRMFCHYDGMFFMIDTGMSRGVAHGRGALLRVEQEGAHTTATAVYTNGEPEVLWKK